MPRSRGHIKQSGFSTGLVTEQNPANPVENSATEMQNFVLERTGDIRRRRGIDRESGYVETNTGIQPDIIGGNRETAAIKTATWDNPGGDVTKEFIVVQTGNKLRFFESSSSSPSANLIGTVTLSTPTITENISGVAPISFSTVNNYLVIASSELSTPYYIQYEKTLEQFLVGKIYIEVRDLWGVDSGFGVDERPTTINSEHQYNLSNQGWSDYPQKVSKTTTTLGNLTAVQTLSRYVDSGDIETSDRVDYKNSTGTWPSNADISNLLSTDEDENVRTNTTPAPKGRFIINAFTRGASRTSLFGYDFAADDLEDTELGRITQVAAAFGRVFYSGVQSEVQGGDYLSPNYSNFVFFSKVVQKDLDLGACHQEADPTSEDFSDLVATDGGFVVITEANNIIGMAQLGGSLLVFADNGVWAITGPDNVFRANDYAVTQLTRTGAISVHSIVAARDSVIYWSHEGIFSIQAKDVTDKLYAQSLTVQSIQTFYNSIPSIAKLYAKGTFDRIEQRVRWLYNDLGTYDGVEERWRYNKELIMDLVIPAFYVNDFSVDWVLGYVSTSPYSSVLNSQDVVYGGDPVEYLGEQVTYTTSERTSALSKTKYLIEGYSSDYPTGVVTEKPENLMITFAELRNEDFLDWAGNQFVNSIGLDAEATLVGSWVSGGDFTRNKNIEYLHMFFRRTETGVDANGVALGPSGCLGRVRWEYSNSTSSGKWSPQRQWYRYKRLYITDGTGELEYGKEVIVTKNRVRGTGNVLAMELTSEPGKDLHLYGYAISILGDEVE